MKKLMFAAVAALAMVGAANAAPSYGIDTWSYLSPYSKDTNPSDEHCGRYNGYVMKQEDAQAAMGTQETVTYATMSEWLGKNFAENKASVIANAERIYCAEYYSTLNQYSLGLGGEEVSGLGSAIGVFFYDDSANLAYNVLPNCDATYFYFNDSSSAGSGWQAASVPEPTSAMLMLLGVAGLALKRKRT